VFFEAERETNLKGYRFSIRLSYHRSDTLKKLTAEWVRKAEADLARRMSPHYYARRRTHSLLIRARKRR
jgi:hypothetical protein